MAGLELASASEVVILVAELQEVNRIGIHYAEAATEPAMKTWKQSRQSLL